jgi:antitoxin component of MazEF toxin-antitoxin module
MTEYKVKRKVIKLGARSLVVSLPYFWAEAKGVKAGDEVEVLFGNDGSLKVRPSSIRVVKKIAEENKRR